MEITNVQSNLTIGEISPDMAARIDLPAYAAALSKAQNVVIMPHGGVRRRPGLTKTKDSLLTQLKKPDGVLGTAFRMFSFEFSTEQDYLVLVQPMKVSIFHNGELQAEITQDVWNWDTPIQELDAAQSGDVMIFTSQDYMPKMLRREGSNTAWSLIDVPLTGIPDYDFGQGQEPVWSETRGYPTTVTFFQARLWFGGSRSKPNSVFASKINSFYDFDVGTGQADYGVFDTLDTDQYNKITNIYPGRNLQVYTTGSEFYNTAEYITSTTSAWKRSSGYGSKRLRPIMIDGATIFADRIGRTVRRSVFEFQEDAYVSPSISVMSNHLIRDIKSMDTVKGTNIDISDFLYVVNNDGTIAVMNSLRHQKTEGWTEWTTQGDFIDVCSVNKIVYFLVKRRGEYHIEYLNEGTTLDHNTVYAGQTPITEIDTKESQTIAREEHKLILDNSMQPETTGGIVKFARPANKAETGLDVKMIVRTMPISLNLQQGPTLNEHKRVTAIHLNLRDTLGVYAAKISEWSTPAENRHEGLYRPTDGTVARTIQHNDYNFSPDRYFKVILDDTPKLFTGLKIIPILGYNRVTILEITQEDPLPFKLLGLGYKLEV